MRGMLKRTMAGSSGPSVREGDHDILWFVILCRVLDKGKSFIFKVGEPVLIGANKLLNFRIERFVVNMVG